MRWLIPAAALAAVGGVAVLVVSRGRSESTAPVSASAPAVAARPAPPIPEPKPPVEAPPAAPAALESKVQLKIDSEPAGAEVFRLADGVRVGTTPCAAEMDRASGATSFVVKLAGYRDGRVDLPLARDGAAHVALVQVKTVEVKHARPAEKRPLRAKKPVKNGVIDPFDN
jgi:hypothetical protein